MKVIGAGLPRTGTLSQKVALEMLGFGPCYHMVNVLGNLDEVRRWRAAMDDKHVLTEIFADYQSTVDWPGSYFYKDLIGLYPDAKVVLSERDPAAWAHSMRDTIWETFHGTGMVGLLSNARALVERPWHDYLEWMGTMWDRSGMMPPDSDGSPGPFMAAIDRYHEEVKREVPAERLLVWSVTEGWGPLCEFLEVDVPDAPFPRVNDTETFGERLLAASMGRLQQWWSEHEAATTA